MTTNRHALRTGIALAIVWAFVLGALFGWLQQGRTRE